MFHSNNSNGDVQAAFKKNRRLRRFDHASRLDATGANRHFFDLARLDGANILEVWIKPTPGFVVGMAHIISEHRLFAANFAYS